MQVGGAEVCITPPHPITMGGYGARKGPSMGTHDELYVRCAYFEDEAGGSVLLSYDLVGVPEFFVDRVKAKIAGDFGVDDARIALTATHTHSGPDISLLFDTKADELKPLYTEMLVAWSASACRMAIQRKQPVDITTGTTKVSGVGGVRRTGANSSLPLRVVGFVEKADDVAVPQLEGEQTEGTQSHGHSPKRAHHKVKVAFVSFPCHPTVMGADNLFVSADYPGACIHMVKSMLGAETVVLFLNGACGDISTRFTRHAQTFDEVERLGCKVGAAAVRLLQSGLAEPLERVRIIQETVPLAAQTNDLAIALDGLEEAARASLAQTSDPAVRRVYETQLQGIAFVRRQGELLKRGQGGSSSSSGDDGPSGETGTSDTLTATVSAWAFDDTAGFVFWPGEPFFSYDERLKQSAGEHTTLIGYANGMVGYIPDVTVDEDMAYEVLMSRCGKAGGEQLLDVSARMYQSLVKE